MQGTHTADHTAIVVVDPYTGYEVLLTDNAEREKEAARMALGFAAAWRTVYGPRSAAYRFHVRAAGLHLDQARLLLLLGPAGSDWR